MQKGKSIIRVILIYYFLMALLLINGCSFKENELSGQAKKSDAKEETTEFDFLDDEDISWEDNMLDEMYAAINLPVKMTEVEGEIKGAGTAGSLVGEAGCVLFRIHVFSSESWSGVNGITPEGEEFSYKLELEEDPKQGVIHRIGIVSGRKGYVASKWMHEGGTFRFYELDETFKKNRSVQVELETDQDISHVMGDFQGNVHVTYIMTNGTQKYVVISPTGEIVFKAEGSHWLSLHAFGEGRIAVCDYETTLNGETRFYEADLESGGVRELSVSKIGAEDKKRIKNYGMYATPLDENRLLCCMNNGVIIYDSSEGKVKNLYQWSNHGILPTQVRDAIMMSDESIGIIYKDKDGLHYILLKPTEKQEEIKSITFAVSPEHLNTYQSAAAYFNAAYPSYNVTIRGDFDETSLLTQLGAGDGPVIVDTAITGFEELESLWQPLDGFLEQTHLAEELIPGALEFGKSGDVTDGIARDFRIGTLVVPKSKESDWNYDGFLNALENSGGGAPLCHWYHETPLDFRQEFFDILKNGLGDNYYFDAKSGEMIFGTKEFERLLRLSESAKKCPPAEEGKAIQEGTALCEVVSASGIEDVVKLRRRLEARGEVAIGYPTKDGARNLLVAGAPIAIRSTATDEEKKIAYTFLAQVLSRDAYTAMSGGDFPVRRDALEDKFENYKTTVSQLKISGVGVSIDMPEFDEEKDTAFLDELIKQGTVQKTFPVGLQKVFDEEFRDYLNGRIDGTALDDHLKSRVWLYLEESK